MRDLVAGGTNFKNQSIKEIAKDLKGIISYSKKIVKDNKKSLQKFETQSDLKWIYQEIILFAEKLIEISKKYYSSLKKGNPELFYCEELIKMGNDAGELNLKIGTTWHGENNYSGLYSGSSAESHYYRELRDYIVSMIDLNNIGFYIKDRYFKDGEPLYKSKTYWVYIRDVLEIIVNSVINFFKLTS